MNEEERVVGKHFIAVCNRCGCKWPVAESPDNHSLDIELPCKKCGYSINAVLACEDEEVTPMGATGDLEEFESLKPGPLNLTERAISELKPDINLRVNVSKYK